VFQGVALVDLEGDCGALGGVQGGPPGGAEQHRLLVSEVVHGEDDGVPADHEGHPADKRVVLEKFQTLLAGELLNRCLIVGHRLDLVGHLRAVSGSG
jgi:hypothetical protein